MYSLLGALQSVDLSGGHKAGWPLENSIGVLRVGAIIARSEAQQVWSARRGMELPTLADRSSKKKHLPIDFSPVVKFLNSNNFTSGATT